MGVRKNQNYSEFVSSARDLSDQLIATSTASPCFWWSSTLLQGTYSRGVAIAPTPIAGRGSMDVGSPSEREIDVKDGSHCLIELVRALV